MTAAVISKRKKANDKTLKSENGAAINRDQNSKSGVDTKGFRRVGYSGNRSENFVAHCIKIFLGYNINHPM